MLVLNRKIKIHTGKENSSDHALEHQIDRKLIRACDGLSNQTADQNPKQRLWHAHSTIRDELTPADRKNRRAAALGLES
jgi:hypothetical protein